MPKQVKIVVDQKGGARVEWFGFEGAACLAASEQMRAALAARFGVNLDTEQIEAKPELEAAIQAGEVSREVVKRLESEKQ